MSNKKFTSGVYKQQKGYKSFSPSFVNGEFNWDDKQIDILLEKANLSLGELNVYSTLVPDVDFFIKMHIAKEATDSSIIEGTKTNLREVLLGIEDITPEKRDDWNEINNYIKAINFSINKLDKTQLSIKLIKESHEILISGVRGYNKRPGEIRNRQNWIGGKLIKDAIFIPPHFSELPKLLSDLESFWRNQKLNIPNLIKAAITHYQFETIHPFLDGNGRIGRLLITLQLINWGMLKKPSLYISDFFEKNRRDYYDYLMLVRKNNDIEKWVKFFLIGILETSEKGKLTFEKILKLRKKYEYTIESGMGVKRFRSGKELLLHLFSRPVVTINDIAGMLSVTFQTASTIAGEFENLGLFEEMTGFSKNRVFVLKEYLNLFIK